MSVVCKMMYGNMMILKSMFSQVDTGRNVGTCVETKYGLVLC